MRGHIAIKNGRYYPVISIKDPGTGQWKRNWLPGHRTKREVEKARAEAVSQANNGSLPLPKRETVAELFHNYFDCIGVMRVRKVTLQSYKSMVENHLIPRFGAKRASALTADDLNLMMSQMLKEKKSVTTVRYVFRIAHIVLRDAVKKGKLIRNVADFADPPPSQPYEATTWNEAQLDSFLSAVSTSEYADIFALLVTTALTGGRRGEALGILWKDVCLEKHAPTLDIHRTVYNVNILSRKANLSIARRYRFFSIYKVVILPIILV
jgi:integrase